LVGKDLWEKAKVDEVCGIIDDIVTEMCKMRYAKDDEKVFSSNGILKFRVNFKGFFTNKKAP
jgi:hypothetical protein